MWLASYRVVCTEGFPKEWIYTYCITPKLAALIFLDYHLKIAHLQSL